MNLPHAMRSLLIGLFASLLIGSATFGQTTQPGGAGGGAGGGGPDAARFIDQLMSNDANGDGKLAKDELPGNFGVRLFEQGDADSDGFLTPDELRAVAGRLNAQGGPGAGGGGGRGGQQISFGGAMNQAGRAIRGLQRSTFDDASRENDLQAVGAVQLGLVGAKSRLMTVPMSTQAKAKYGDDEAAYRKDLRKGLMTAIYAALELEVALMQGDSEAARLALANLEEAEEAGHAMFAEEETPERPAPAAPAASPAPAKPSTPPGGG